MKVAGIIAEYNPFHKGHEYHIKITKELTSADYVVVALSGDFLQRGVPSVMSKYIRTRQALAGGADLVLELPAVYATAAAADFARGGITLLDALGIVGHLSFGCETQNSDLISLISDIILREPGPFKEVLDDRLREGESFPAAREAAVTAVIEAEGRPAGTSRVLIHDIMTGSNSILAIEYHRVLKSMGIKMDPVTVRRAGDGYNEKISGTGFASASGIRERLCSLDRKSPYDPNAGFPGGGHGSLKDHIPDYVTECLIKGWGMELPVMPDDFIYQIGERVRLEKYSGGDLSRFADVSTELANRIQNLDTGWNSFDEVCRALKTRQYTYSRISRGLIHILLDICKSGSRTGAKYVRILGFRQSASPLLKKIRENCRIPVITKPSEAEGLLSEAAKKDFLTDVYASELYEDRVRAVFGGGSKSRFNEYRQNLIIM